METKEKHAGGRPPLFSTVEEIQCVIDAYFESCKPEYVKDADDKIMQNSKGQPVMKLNPPTITGLAIALGFNSRATIYEYEKKNDQFSDTIKKARLLCENYVEKGLLANEIIEVLLL